MTDNADTIASKIRKAKTDPDSLPSEIEGLSSRPEARNLVNIYAALSDTSITAVLQEFGGQQFGTFKPILAELAVNHLAPISNEMARLMADPTEIDRILGDGAQRANIIASPVLEKVKNAIGIVAQ